MLSTEQQVEFSSHGTTCRGLFVRPVSDHPAPLIVLAHGLGGVYEMRLDAYARRFAEAGYAALTFDYRYFGRSDGHPRHLLVREQQQEDIEAAIAFGKTLPGVDGSKVVLWGTSLAGGHVIDVASRRSDLAASIIQAPFTDGLASASATSFVSKIGIGILWVANVMASLLGRPPVLVPLTGPPWWPAMMSKPDVVEGVFALLPHGSRLSGRLSRVHRRRGTKLGPHVAMSEEAEPFEIGRFVGSIILSSGTVLINGVSANFGLDIVFWRPGKNLAQVRSPMLVCACEGDSVAPPGPTLTYARRSDRCDLMVYPYGHFDIYVDEPFEVVIKDQLAFLARVVPTAIPSRAQAPVPSTPRTPDPL
ncbi:MAG TPA: alpha/beta fold hydrolase [Polyangiaceae bacterium]